MQRMRLPVEGHGAQWQQPATGGAVLYASARREALAGEAVLLSHRERVRRRRASEQRQPMGRAALIARTAETGTHPGGSGTWTRRRPQPWQRGRHATPNGNAYMEPIDSARPAQLSLRRRLLLSCQASWVASCRRRRLLLLRTLCIVRVCVGVEKEENTDCYVLVAATTGPSRPLPRHAPLFCPPLPSFHRPRPPHAVYRHHRPPEPRIHDILIISPQALFQFLRHGPLYAPALRRTWYSATASPAEREEQAER